jgi:hypothetical protein
MREFKLILTFLIFTMISCTPQQASKNGSCNPGEVFSDTARSCVTDTTPQIPIANTSSITIDENSDTSTHTLSYTDYDKDAATSCTVVPSALSVGFQGVLDYQGVIYKLDESIANSEAYTLEIIDGAASPSDVGVFVDTVNEKVIIQVDAGNSTSNHIVTRIDASAEPISAILSESFVFQTTVSGEKFVGALCSCINGDCSLELKPRTDYDGNTFLAYYISDQDGSSSLKTIFVTVNNVDRPPVTTPDGTHPQVVLATSDPYVINEDATRFDIRLPYSDYDGDYATYCDIKTVPTNKVTDLGCICVLGVCEATLAAVTDYDDPTPFPVTYTVTANGAVSDTGTINVEIKPFDDLPKTDGLVTKDLSTVLSLVETTDDEFGKYTIAGGTFISEFYEVDSFVASDDGVDGVDGDKNGKEDVDVTFKVGGVPANFIDDGTSDGCLDNDDSTDCVLQFTGEENGYHDFTYEVTGQQSGSKVEGTITIYIAPRNDAPTFTPGLIYVDPDESVAPRNRLRISGNRAHPAAVTYNVDESRTWNPQTDDLVSGGSTSLPTADAIEIFLDDNFFGDSGGTPYDITYHLFIPGTVDAEDVSTGSISTDGRMAKGVLSGCLGIDGADTTDVDCQYTPYDGNAVGDGDTFYYVAQDFTGEYLEYQQVKINIVEKSDVPTMCAVSEYNLEIGRTECGDNLCIGDDSPSFAPSSHTTDDPVIYFDKKYGVCYKSTGVTADDWVRVKTAFPKYEFGESEVIYIRNIIVNEGGTSSENLQDITYSLISGQSSYSSDQGLLPIDGNVLNQDDTSFDTDTACGGSTCDTVNFAAKHEHYPTGDADTADYSILTLRLLPKSGQFGTTTISFNVEDGENVTPVSFDLTIRPLSVGHQGWSKIVSKGVKTSKTLGTLEYNEGISASTVTMTNYDVHEKISTCSYSRDKCNDGQPCYSSTAGSPSASADFRGAIYKTGDGCYYAENAGTSDWVKFDPFCNISEVKRLDANSAYSCSVTQNACGADESQDCENALSCVPTENCDGGQACTSSVVTDPNVSGIEADAVNAIYKAADGRCYYAKDIGVDNWEMLYTDPVNEQMVSSDGTFTISVDPIATSTVDTIYKNEHGTCYQYQETAPDSGIYAWTDISSSTIFDESVNTCHSDLGSVSCVGDGAPNVSGVAGVTGNAMDPSKNQGVFYYNSTAAHDSHGLWIRYRLQCLPKGSRRGVGL